MRSIRVLTVAVVVALVVLGGLVTRALVAGPPAGFGWSAYTPDPQMDVFGGDGSPLVVVGRGEAVAVVVAAVVLAAATGLLGYALGRRRAAGAGRR
ncbi:hypothetical protein SAMN06264364_10838 [Quadrisphaera granulorum]|uniref:Uncharacterized protein n=1 Tax=Quadrisphaera granulorum TaxID=317664 RepID=A0A316A8V3_9ACTN|nr:hypothetical protein [Quadrisphaera granulorum]PWJ54131.1 hypothetical protein BXY45_10838 [Quadrisphaera granulorum]SZE96270.1 hypothetical protein SAMN06264364_10838 [Quadrisphaera granulorum]